MQGQEYKNILSVSHIWALQQSYCGIIPVLLYRKQESSVGCLGNVELKIISYENKSSIISLLLTLIFPIMAKSQVKIQQTAGRDALGEFAPEFARLNDDILFGEV